MFLPKCPRCGNRLPIVSFLIRSKPDPLNSEKPVDSPKIQCGSCKAAIRMRPLVHTLLVGVWCIAGVVVLIATLVREFTYKGYLILLVVLILAGLCSMLLSWRFLEIANSKNREKV
jgi:hypothetical protein